VSIAKDRKLSTLRLPNGAILAIGAKPAPNAHMHRIFSLLVLTAREFQFPASDFPGVRVMHVPLPDGPLTATDRVKARSAAKVVAAYLRSGRSVLVTCAMGLNRSALVASLALVALGCPRPKAIATVRAMRGGLYAIPFHKALSNEHFTRLIEQEESSA
jgi:protein-tyrosine phosphatase